MQKKTRHTNPFSPHGANSFWWYFNFFFKISCAPATFLIFLIFLIYKLRIVHKNRLMETLTLLEIYIQPAVSPSWTVRCGLYHMFVLCYPSNTNHFLMETEWNGLWLVGMKISGFCHAPGKNFTSPPLQRGSVWFPWEKERERERWIQPQHVQSTSNVLTLTWINVLHNL